MSSSLELASEARRRDQATLAAFFIESPAFRSGELKVEPLLHRDEPILSGRFRTSWMRPGLGLHVSDVEYLHDLRTSSFQRTGFGFYLFLEAGDELEAEIGGKALPIGRHRVGGSVPVGFVMTWARPERFVRRTTSGTRVRKVLIVVSDEWLNETFGKQNVALPAASREHLAISRWMPSRRLAGAVMQLLEPDPRGAAASRLRDESLVLDLLTEALVTLQPPLGARHGSAAMRRNDTILVNRARDIVEAGLATELSVAKLAEQLGIGIASLQRLFRASFGCSAYEYVRIRRLEVARSLLEQGRSVAVAAQAVGYTNAANFATAFRRKFGLTPSQARDSLLP